MPVPSACFLLLPIAPMSSPEFHRHRRFAPFAWPARLGHAPLLPPCAPSPPTRAQPTRTFSAARRALLSHHGELGQSSNGTAAGAPPPPPSTVDQRPHASALGPRHCRWTGLFRATTWPVSRPQPLQYCRKAHVFVRNQLVVLSSLKIIRFKSYF
jgi:hypothetical protein